MTKFYPNPDGTNFVNFAVFFDFPLDPVAQRVPSLVNQAPILKLLPNQPNRRLFENHGQTFLANPLPTRFGRVVPNTPVRWLSSPAEFYVFGENHSFLALVFIDPSLYGLNLGRKGTKYLSNRSAAFNWDSEVNPKI